MSTIRERIRDGGAAVRAGTPDYNQNDSITNATDAITNILHWLDRANGGIAVDIALRDAEMHWHAERSIPLDKEPEA